ncbi:DUF262 domain-containing protein [Chryseobacterium sp. RP-3-3]|uniref:DUF262 domain-containing protein n=1 Tax=Chryseobacterium antibioticum TaxID=2728847 RepID=A0A7Y0APT8_9FLAO|nr:DUF262 domain-containing protein [Chryseobacterium antibioticum]NML71271.1 DUF262 domain-containing protein [Chryseobacterium antibioticum]
MNEGLNKEIIKLDEDVVDDSNSSSSLYPYDPILNDLDMGVEQFSIFELLRQKKKQKIITQPDFQRNLVWNTKAKSKFVESILLNFPIPFIYFNERIDSETKESKYMIIDGLQRTTTLEEFYNNQFPLSQLEAVPKYNGFFYKDLPDNLQAKFEDKKLNIFILKPSTPMEVIYDLFNRINTGGTQLNRQEIRNCIFIGKSTALLKELSEEPYFKSAISDGVSPQRMKDRELILRYIAFRYFDYEKEYIGNLSNYIEDAMRKINKWSGKQIEEVIKDFERVMKYSYQIWGDKNFRIPTLSTKGTINMAVFESVSHAISLMSDDFIKKNKNTIKKNYTQLIRNQSYIDAVTRSTNTKERVNTRFNLATETLKENIYD